MTQLSEKSVYWGARIASSWLVVAGTILLLGSLSKGMTLERWPWIYLLWSLVSSGLCYAMAQGGLALNLGGWKLGSNAYYAFALAGGWPGAFLARRFLKNPAREPWQLGFLWSSFAMHIFVVLAVFRLA